MSFVTLKSIRISNVKFMLFLLFRAKILVNKRVDVFGLVVSNQRDDTKSFPFVLRVSG